MGDEVDGTRVDNTLGTLGHRLEVQRKMLDASVDCIKVLSPDGRLVEMNRSGCEALLVDPAGGFGQVWLELLPERVRDAGEQALTLALHGKNARFRGYSPGPGDRETTWDNVLTPIVEPDGTVTAILCLSRDVTRTVEAEERLQRYSERDDLTDLLNRRAFTDAAARLVHAATASSPAGLMLLDLDDFKHINDTHGYHAGDALLKTVATRVVSTAPDDAVVARLGGDEFAVVVPRVDDRDIVALGERLNALARKPTPCDGHRLSTGISVGCVLAPRDGHDLSTLLRRANIALHCCKAAGKGGATAYSQQMHDDEADHLDQIGAATRLLDSRTPPRARYAPRVRLSDRTILAYAAQAEWRLDGRSIVAAEALPAAMEILDIAAPMLVKARTAILESIPDDAGPNRRVSLRVEPVQLVQTPQADHLLRALDEAGVAPDCIEVEVDADVLATRGAEVVRRGLHRLRQAGVRVGLRGVGEGALALQALVDMPVDLLLLSPTLVASLDDPGTRGVGRAICGLAAELGLPVVADGVRTDLQIRQLQALGCELVQGPSLPRTAPQARPHRPSAPNRLVPAPRD